MSTVYPVIGVMRSGTTVTTAVLHTLGVPAGTDWWTMEEPEGWGPGPSMIDAEFHDLHHRMLAYTIPPVGADLPAPEHRPAYRELVGRRLAAHPRWAVKCHWLPFLPDEFAATCRAVGCDVRPVITWRCPDESIKSYAARTELDYATIRAELEPWFTAVAEWRQRYAGRFLEVRYPDLIADPTGEVARIADWCGVPVTDKAVASVDPTWCRFTPLIRSNGESNEASN